MNKMTCSTCGVEVETRIEKRQETYPVKGVPIQIQATVRVCTRCGEAIWDSELDNGNLRVAFNEYRRQNGLLMPDEIKAIREMYGLSQVAFAKALGLGEKTITRYENGSLQEEAINNLIYLMKDKRNFEMLRDKGANLTNFMAPQREFDIRITDDRKDGWDQVVFLTPIPAA